MANKQCMKELKQICLEDYGVELNTETAFELADVALDMFRAVYGDDWQVAESKHQAQTPS